jgi:hypothetical protein
MAEGAPDKKLCLIVFVPSKALNSMGKSSQLIIGTYKTCSDNRETRVQFDKSFAHAGRMKLYGRRLVHPPGLEVGGRG